MAKESGMSFLDRAIVKSLSDAAEVKKNYEMNYLGAEPTRYQVDANLIRMKT